MIEVSKAKGSYIYDHKNKRYLDFVAGVSACSVGHCNKEVINAIKDQSEMYMHVMVYGEFVTKPSLELAKLLAKNLPNSLNCTYFTNSGTEALEGSMKLARRFTGRKKIIAAKRAGAELILVPVANFEEAKQFRTDKTAIVGVDSFNEALSVISQYSSR